MGFVDKSVLAIAVAFVLLFCTTILDLRTMDRLSNLLSSGSGTLLSTVVEPLNLGFATCQVREAGGVGLQMPSLPHGSAERMTMARALFALDGGDESLLTCNWENGNWVPSRTVPLYSGRCKFVPQPFKCDRQDRNLSYLHYSWKSRDCGGAFLPIFDPSQFLEVMRNKVMYIVGEKAAVAFGQALACSLDLAELVQKHTIDYPVPRTMRYYIEAYNVTIYEVSISDIIQWKDDRASFDAHGVTHQQGRDVAYLDRPNVKLQTLLQSREQIDVVLVSASQRWGPRSKRVYVLNNQVVNYDWAKAYYTALTTLGDLFRTASLSTGETGSDLSPSPTPPPVMKKAATEGAAATDLIWTGPAFKGVPFFLTHVAKHIQTPDARLPDNDPMLAFHSARETNGWACAAQPAVPVKQRMESDIQWQENSELEREVLGSQYGFRILDVSRMSLLRPDAHTMFVFNRSSKRGGIEIPPVFDCGDWCLPGVPDSWLGFFQTLLLREVQSMRDCVQNQ